MNIHSDLGCIGHFCAIAIKRMSQHHCKTVTVSTNRSRGCFARKFHGSNTGRQCNLFKVLIMLSLCTEAVQKQVPNCPKIAR